MFQAGILAACMRSNVVTCLIALLVVAANPASDSPTSDEVERAGVRIRVTVRSSIYTWEVTNVSAPLITAFEVGQHVGYDFKAPDDWSVETTPSRFRAWTTDIHESIRPGKTGTFSQRVSSRGGVLGRVAATVGFHAGPPVTFAGVWGPRAEARSAILTVPAVVILIVVVHVLLVVRRGQDQPTGEPTGA